jgi:hypothetical protein
MLRLQLKAAVAKSYLLEERLLAMELHVEGNQQGHNQKMRLVVEEKNK